MREPSECLVKTNTLRTLVNFVKLKLAVVRYIHSELPYQGLREAPASRGLVNPKPTYGPNGTFHKS
jgi:hypothetical protein